MIAIVSTFLSSCAPPLRSISVSVFNDTNVNRNGELVEVDLREITTYLQPQDSFSLRVINEAGQELMTQQTYDGLLLFPVNVRAHGSASFQIELNDDAINQEDIEKKSLTYHRIDIGKDKRKIELINIQHLFRVVSSQQTGSYEMEVAGEKGKMSNYKLTTENYGFGLSTINANDSLAVIRSMPWQDYTVLDRGPLRTSVRMRLKPQKIEGEEIVETRLISIDAGSTMNKIEVVYEGARTSKSVITRLMKSSSNDASSVRPELGYMAVADKSMLMGCLFPYDVDDAGTYDCNQSEKRKLDAEGFVFMESNYEPGTSFVYYAGAIYRRNDADGNIKQWCRELSHATQRARRPLQISIIP